MVVIVAVAMLIIRRKHFDLIKTGHTQSLGRLAVKGRNFRVFETITNVD